MRGVLSLRVSYEDTRAGRMASRAHVGPFLACFIFLSDLVKNPGCTAYSVGVTGAEGLDLGSNAAWEP